MGQSYFESNIEDANVFVEMHLSGKVYEIEHFTTIFSQDTAENTLEPKGDVDGGVLTITMVQVPDNELLQWAASKWIRKSGEIVFKNDTATPILRIEFEEAACVDFGQTCNEGVGSIINLTISPKIVSFNGIRIEKPWQE